MERRKSESSTSSSLLSLGLVLATMTVSACGEEELVGGAGGPTNKYVTDLCIEVRSATVYGVQKDGIPALSNPPLVDADDPFADYLHPRDRVIGLNLPTGYLAVPHNILWWHEIVNFDDTGLAVTYCPLTGSSMVFHRATVDGAEFGVSGLLFQNNLVMYDRAEDADEETLWPQMLAGGRCGPGEERELSMFPIIEMQWENWVALHPDTKVVSKKTGMSQLYRRELYPYGLYELLDNAQTLYPLEFLDPRRLPKERVLGIPLEGGGGVTFPFGVLADRGNVVAIHETLADSREVVVLWDADAFAAMAFRPVVGSRALTFIVSGGVIVDEETGSEWSVDGEAISGPLVGQRLGMIREAYVSFWFAFTTFYPDATIWQP